MGQPAKLDPLFPAQALLGTNSPLPSTCSICEEPVTRSRWAQADGVWHLASGIEASGTAEADLSWP